MLEAEGGRNCILGRSSLEKNHLFSSLPKTKIQITSRLEDSDGRKLTAG